MADVGSSDAMPLGETDLNVLREKQKRLEELEAVSAAKTSQILDLEVQVGLAKAVEEATGVDAGSSERLAELEAISKAKDAEIASLQARIEDAWEDATSRTRSGPSVSLSALSVRDLSRCTPVGAPLVIRMRVAGAETGVQAVSAGNRAALQMPPLAVAAQEAAEGVEVELGYENSAGAFMPLGVASPSLPGLARRAGRVWLQFSSALPQHICDIECEFQAFDEAGAPVPKDLPAFDTPRVARKALTIESTKSDALTSTESAPSLADELQPYEQYTQPTPKSDRPRVLLEPVDGAGDF